MQKIFLTDEQRNFASENHNLIYTFLYKHKLSCDDWYDVAAIGFCKAVAKYDPERRRAFSTFAFAVMLNDVRHEMRKEQSRGKKSVAIVSIQSELCDGFSIEETLGYEPCYFVDGNELQTDTAILIRSLTSKQQEIISYLKDGLKQKEIAENLSLSQPQVSRLIKNIRELMIKQQFGGSVKTAPGCPGTSIGGTN